MSFPLRCIKELYAAKDILELEQFAGHKQRVWQVPMWWNTYLGNRALTVGVA